VPTLHTVTQGECLFTIARQYGFHNWKDIYDAPDNEEFKKARPNPNAIYPGDQLVIPDPKESTKKEACGTEDLHKFKVKLPRILFRVKVHDEENEPVAGKKYKLFLDKNVLEGSTDGDGIVEQKITTAPRSAKLVVYMGAGEEDEQLIWDVGIGHLDPHDSIEGIKERLNNMGYYCGPTDQKLTLGLSIALRTFQKDNDLELTGDLDDATIAKLKEIHGEK
jgi:hypothetical protein